MPTRVQLRRDAGRIGPAGGPWIRARQIAKWLGAPHPAELVQLLDRRGEILGWGLPSEASAIALRMVAWGSAPPPEDWLERRLAAALRAREVMGFDAQPTTGIRLVNSEGDGLPGLVIDRYDDARVVQITTAPMAARQARIVALLREQSSGPVHVLRPEAAAQAEGFEPEVERDGDEPLRFVEHGLRLCVPPPPSQKTGAYFDQRANRRFVAALARHGQGPLLDLGCHVGGFSLHAAAAGVPAVGVDRSAAMLELAAEHLRLNDLSEVQWVQADLFGPLHDPRLRGPFGTIVVDPPKIASKRKDAGKAAAAMAKLVARVATRLRVGGHLVLCSCSHHLGVPQLDQCTFEAAGQWSRVALRGADVDHPIAPGHVEGEYLRVAVYQRRA